MINAPWRCGVMVAHQTSNLEVRVQGPSKRIKLFREVWLIWCWGCGVRPLASHVLIYSRDMRPCCLTSHQLYGYHAQWLMSVPISGPGCGHVWLVSLLSAPWYCGVMVAHQTGNLEMRVQVPAGVANFSEKFDWSDVGDVGYAPLPLMYWYIHRIRDPVAWSLTNYMAVMPSGWYQSPYLVLGVDMYGW